MSDYTALSSKHYATLKEMVFAFGWNLDATVRKDGVIIRYSTLEELSPNLKVVT